MKASYTFLLATGLAAQQVAATWDLFGSPFKSPRYNENECSDKQKGGFNWADLKDGDSNFNYGDFDFSKNWKCANSFGKGDAKSKRSFGSKCIKNTISKQKPASFGCDKRKSGFSIRDIDVSVEFDVDVEFHFIMKDGSKCKQVSPCSKSGSTVKNTQCGGAISVDVLLPKHEKSDKECEIGFHNIGFDCDAGKGYSPPSLPPPPPPPPPPSPPKVPSASAPVGSKPPTTSSAVESAPPVSETPASSGTPNAPPTETASGSCDSGYGGSCESTTGVPPPMSPPYSNSSAPASAPYAVPTPPQTTEVKTTMASSQTESSPATPPPTMESSKAVPCDGSYGSPCDGTSAMQSYNTGYPVPENSTASIPQPSSPPNLPPANPSEVLPKCMNTWLQIDSTCKDNTDSACYCKNPDFTKNVIDCVSAWCGTDEDTREALQYLIGICAEHVPENPGLVTNCPTYVPLNPPTPTAPPAASETGGVGETPRPEGPSGGAMGGPHTTITYGSTTLTMPQVHFTTQTNEAGTDPTAPVGLILGTAPAEIVASTTGGMVPGVPGTTLATAAPTTTRLGTGTGVSGPTRPAQGTAPAEFTGAALALQVDTQQVAVVGAVLALFAL